MDPIFLIGFMGCGKTTLGRALGRATGLRFVDLDSMIEARSGLSIARLFALQGPEGFRALESEVLAEVAAAAPATPTVVACGGGTPCFNGNMDLMNRAGTTVWLTAPPGVILTRLKQARDGRPLLAGKTDAELEAFVVASLDERRPHYSRAAFTFDSSRLETAAQIGESVARFANTFNLQLLKND